MIKCRSTDRVQAVRAHRHTNINHLSLQIKSIDSILNHQILDVCIFCNFKVIEKLLYIYFFFIFLHRQVRTLRIYIIFHSSMLCNMRHKITSKKNFSLVVWIENFLYRIKFDAKYSESATVNLTMREKKRKENVVSCLFAANCKDNDMT